MTFRASPDVPSVELHEHPRWQMSASQQATGEMHVDICCRTPDALGEFDDVLEFLPKNRAGVELLACPVRVQGEIVRDAVPAPRVVEFRRYPIGLIVQQQISIRSLTGKSCQVEKVVPDLKGCTVTSETDATGGLTWRVSQQVVEPGQVLGKIVVHLLDAENQRVSVEVPVTYFGYQTDETGRMP